MELPIKFFDRDVIEGKHSLIGDEFKAHFMGRTPWFKLVETGDGCFFGTIILHRR